MFNENKFQKNKHISILYRSLFVLIAILYYVQNFYLFFFVSFGKKEKKEKGKRTTYWIEQIAE